MNVELLEKVKAHILEEPRRFNLDYWGGIVDPNFYNDLYEADDDSDGEIESILAKQRPPCGAVGCIAGNVCILAGIVKPSERFNKNYIYELPQNTLELAAEALGIEYQQAARLFYLSKWDRAQGNGWPEPFESRLEECDPGTLEYAQVTAERIDHFIKTNGAE